VHDFKNPNEWNIDRINYDHIEGNGLSYKNLRAQHHQQRFSPLHVILKQLK